ncbi:hypothetical protein CgunFtcFv8_000015 [Champsocephalus gunnari]|uniref:Uncharacterized protein n=1 Tax=Champsocephalus gunnari TaxID=52237 RepID=A0AAN8DGY2_CHAGU|nr:hypothetical protein CgunFtcFv8_000015 [Champsocephalus gunnari]
MKKVSTPSQGHCPKQNEGRTDCDCVPYPRTDGISGSVLHDEGKQWDIVRGPKNRGSTEGKARSGTRSMKADLKGYCYTGSRWMTDEAMKAPEEGKSVDQE